MTKNELEDKLTKSLKDFILKKGYYNTGKLYDSISVIVVDINDNINLKFESMEYIKYLDNGKFLKEYMSLKEIKELVNLYLKTKIKLALKG